MLDYRNFKIRKCTKNDIDQILELQEEIIKSLEDKEYLRVNDEQMFMNCVTDPNVTVGVYDNDVLVAIAILFDGKDTEEDLSIKLKKHTVNKSINFKLVLVKSEYRGNKFQISLMNYLEKVAYAKGYTDICTTVSEKNKYSYRNMIKQGFSSDHSEMKYGGVSREVLCKNIKKPVGDYNKNILNTVASIEGKKSDDSLVTEGVNFSRCFRGNIGIANTGDVLEYLDYDTGKTFYGLFVNRVSPHVCIYIPSEEKIKVVEYSEKIDSLVLQTVWINTIG